MNSPCLAAPFATPQCHRPSPSLWSHRPAPLGRGRREADHSVFAIFCIICVLKKQDPVYHVSWSTVTSTLPTDPYFWGGLRLISGVSNSNLYLLSNTHVT